MQPNVFHINPNDDDHLKINAFHFERGTPTDTHSAASCLIGHKAKMKSRTLLKSVTVFTWVGKLKLYILELLNYIFVGGGGALPKLKKNCCIFILTETYA